MANTPAGLGSFGLRAAAFWALGTGCAVMQVPPPLRALAPVEVERDRRSGAVGPFTFELVQDEGFFRDRTDRQETWDFGVELEGRSVGSGVCRNQLRWPGQAVGDPPERGRDLRRSLECTLTSLSSTTAITLALEAGGPGEELVGFAQRGTERVEVQASHEVEGGRLLSGRRMGFVLSRGGVPWAAIQTVNDRRAWLPPLRPDTKDLLGLVMVALATTEPFLEEVTSP